MADRPPPPPDRRFYGRRRGRPLRPRRRQLMETLLPRLAVQLPEPGGRIDLIHLFGRPVADLWVEVGFGAGEHLAWQALRNPEAGLIGCEPFLEGVGKLLSRIATDPRLAGLDNIRVHADDARPLIEALPDASVGRLFLLFPDPWPKRRHRRRRFVQPAMMKTLARVMRPGAELRLASDDRGLLDWMLHVARGHPAFRWQAGGPADFLERPPDWPATRYEEKAIRGRPAFLRFVREDGLAATGVGEEGSAPESPC